jgi:hypothetical protein
MVREADQIWWNLNRLHDERVSVEWNCCIKVEAFGGQRKWLDGKAGARDCLAVSGGTPASTRRGFNMSDLAWPFALVTVEDSEQKISLKESP